jgi:thioredoxin-related protein
MKTIRHRWIVVFVVIAFLQPFTLIVAASQQAQRSAPAANPPRPLPEQAKPKRDIYPAPEKVPTEITAALHAAAQDHKRVLLVFGGNWCSDCHVLDEWFRSERIASLVNQDYHVVHVNVGNFDKNVDLAMKYDIPLEKGVPSLAVLDWDGLLLVSQKKGEFESTARIGPKDVIEFLERWKSQRCD